MDLWQMIEADHANIQELCREVLRATGGGPNSRAHLFDGLVDEVERHLHAKRHVIYPALARDSRTRGYLGELEREYDDIQACLDELADDPDKNDHEWAMDFKELVGAIRHAFSLEENGVLVVARSALPAGEAQALLRAYEREKIAVHEARRWHLPEAAMPSRYGLPTGTVFGLVAGVAAIGAGMLLWQMNRPGPAGGRESPSYRKRSQERSPARSRSMPRRPAAPSHAGSDEAMLHGAGADSAPPLAGELWFSPADPPQAPSSLATPLQPRGLAPGGGPAGSVGTGGRQAERRDAGSVKRDV